ncbi:MAG TPA: hypothetical protein VFB68_16945 [Xanthobacteraceae bacterium]|nr:hypothetical protein [Xanthobacteraceae bacterium]
MPRPAKTRIVFSAAVAVALLSLEFTTDAFRPAAAADKIPRMPPAEEMRWWDERIGRTTLMAFFQGPPDRHCSTLAGVLTRQGDRVELLYPRVVAPTVWHGSRDTAGELLFEDERCHIRVHFTQEIPDGDRWVALAPQRRSGSFSFGGQELPRVPGLHVIPSAHGNDMRMTLGLIESDEGNGLVSRVVLLPKSPQGACPDWTGLFTIVPAGVMLVFQSTRDQLPFATSSHALPADRSVSFVLATAACRLTIKIEKDVMKDDEWTRPDPQLD